MEYRTLIYTYSLRWDTRHEKSIAAAAIAKELEFEQGTGEQYEILYSGADKAAAEAAYRREIPVAGLYGGSFDELVVNWVALEVYTEMDGEELFMDVLAEKYPEWDNEMPRVKTRGFINHPNE